MKFTSTLLFCLLFFTSNSQQWKFTSSYSLGLPKQEMGKNIQPAHSLQTGILYQLPGALKQLSAGLEFGIGNECCFEQMDSTGRQDTGLESALLQHFANDAIRNRLGYAHGECRHASSETIGYIGSIWRKFLFANDVRSHGRAYST